MRSTNNSSAKINRKDFQRKTERNTASEIIHIKDSEWFTTLIHYPRTVEQMKLLVSVIDGVGIMDPYDIFAVEHMQSNKLNILYAVLRIMNKVSNGCLDYVVEKIFICGLKDLFNCSDLTAYDLFFDQLTQDFHYFVPHLIKLHYKAYGDHSARNTTASTIKEKFENYLRTTFKKPFYVKLMKKLRYNIKNNFYEENNQFFLNIAQDFLNYTEKYLSETYETMNMFLEKIFDQKCSNKTIEDIVETFNKHINLSNLFEENCSEIDIYSEYKLNDDDANVNDANDVNDLNDPKILYNIRDADTKYKIYSPKSDSSNYTLFQPFINHNLVSNEKELLELVLQILIKYKRDPHIINKRNSPSLFVRCPLLHNSSTANYDEITLEDYYHLYVNKTESYDDFCIGLAFRKNLTDKRAVKFIFRLLAKLFGVEIILFENNTNGTGLAGDKITFGTKKYTQKINIYECQPNNYHTIYVGDQFVPITKHPQPNNFLLKRFKDPKIDSNSKCNSKSKSSIKNKQENIYEQL